MPITYPITFPSDCIRAVTIRARNVVGMSASPFTGQQQIYRHPGQWWEMEVSLPPMKRAAAEEVNAFLISLNGKYGTFLLGDPANSTTLGVGTGSPAVYSDFQTGDTLETDGWTPNVTGILKAGDWVQLGTSSATRLYKVLADANSDGAGYASLSIWPNLRTSPSSGEPLFVSNAKGQWRLSTNEHNYTIEPGQIYGMTFACVEAL